MNLTSLLHIGHVAVDVEVSSKEALIDKLIEMIADHPLIVDVGAVKKAVIERENMMSTGVGKGLALPHAKTKAVGGMIGALVTTSSPVEYGSLDNEPVRIVFLLVGKLDSKSLHVRILSRVSRVMNSRAVRQQILSAKTSDELLTIISQNDDHPISD